MNFAEPEKAGKVLLKKQCGGLRAEAAEVEGKGFHGGREGLIR